MFHERWWTVFFVRKKNACLHVYLMNLCVFACKTHRKKKCPSLSRDANVSIIMMLIKTQFSEKKVFGVFENPKSRCLVFFEIWNSCVRRAWYPPYMSTMRILDFWHFWMFRERAQNKPGVIGRRSIGFQIAQYSYFTDSKRSWPPISTQHSYESHTSLHELPEKHILWVFSKAHSSSGWVLILSKNFWLKNMDLQL